MSSPESHFPGPEAQTKALLNMLRRTGVIEFRLGISPDDDGEPRVWYVVGTWPGARHEAEAGLLPIEALERLAERVVDGGTCTHCGRMTSFVPDTDPTVASAVTPPDALLDALSCAYRWDPELEVYRRSCEGDT